MAHVRQQRRRDAPHAVLRGRRAQARGQLLQQPHELALVRHREVLPQVQQQLAGLEDRGAVQHLGAGARQLAQVRGARLGAEQGGQEL